LVQIFRRYGEEPYAKQIARKIEAARLIQPIETTLQLVQVIKSALPSKVLSQKGHPAKQVFQALRIEVNAELEVLENVLDDAIELLKPDGRLAVLTFHSLEDRMVKQAFQKRIKSDIPSKLPLVDLPESKFSLISHKAITSSESELEANTRAHSAKLRILRKN
jgi:16S rRNA (cytosine1402-N4)-methyltransferase